MSNELKTASYDQYSDIPNIESLGLKSKIIFSEKAYKHLNELIYDSKIKNAERGCFFVGRKSENDPFIIYIDYYTSEFECKDAFYPGGSVDPTDKNYEELNEKVNEYNQNNITACIIHFHVHHSYGKNDIFSDQDLHMTAKMQFDNSKYSNFSMLAFPKENAFGLSFIYPVNPEIKNGVGCADFYMFPNMYYCLKNEIYQIGGFEKQYIPEKTVNKNFSIVKNSGKFPGTKIVTAVGKNPNTNIMINDDNVGYIDANNIFCFFDENLNVNFPSLSSSKKL